MAPPRRTYRTSQGKTVDLGALLLQNENVRAVGNMGVNARGDRIDNKGKSIDSKVQQTKRQYNKQIGPVDEIPATSRRAVEDVLLAPVAPDPYVASVKQTEKKTKAPKAKKPKVSKPKADPVVEPSGNDGKQDQPIYAEEPQAATAPLPAGGLADAIARARTIKQEEAKTPRQLAQEKAGVRKI